MIEKNREKKIVRVRDTYTQRKQEREREKEREETASHCNMIM